MDGEDEVGGVEPVEFGALVDDGAIERDVVAAEGGDTGGEHVVHEDDGFAASNLAVLEERREVSVVDDDYGGVSLPDMAECGGDLCEGNGGEVPGEGDDGAAEGFENEASERGGFEFEGETGGDASPSAEIER